MPQMRRGHPLVGVFYGRETGEGNKKEGEAKMYAKFDDTGKLGVYDKEGKLLVAGTPNSSEVASFQHPLLD